ncbi:MAG: DUF5666 domain-containing protein [Ktedonobacteraceae bacterium]
MKRIFSLLPVVMFAALLAACGSSSATASNVNSTATSTPTTACLSVTTGTIQSVNNNTLQVTNLQGKSVQVTVTGTTVLTRQATLTAADLKTGSPVTVIVKQNADSTYSALSVSARATLTRQSRGGFGNGTKLCGGQRRGNGTGGFGGPGFGSGTPGATGSAQSRQTINGTVSSINGNALTVTDTSGNDFTVTLTATTRMMQQQSLTVSDLQSGQAVTITGTANSQGVINASSVSLLQALPTRRGTPTATPTSEA